MRSYPNSSVRTFVRPTKIIPRMHSTLRFRPVRLPCCFIRISCCRVSIRASTIWISHSVRFSEAVVPVVPLVTELGDGSHNRLERRLENVCSHNRRQNGVRCRLVSWVGDDNERGMELLKRVLWMMESACVS